MTFEQAAAIPQAAVLALQGFRKGKIGGGRNVLINGATGDVGSFAVPIAKSFGAEVTGVCSTPKMNFVRSLGADHVIDYTREAFTRNNRQYDLILNVKEFHSISVYKRALTPNGIYVIIGGKSALVNPILLLGPRISLFGKKKMGLLLHKPKAGDLDFVKTLFQAGKIPDVIDKHYPLSEVAEAVRNFAEGRARRRVVITHEIVNNQRLVNGGIIILL